MTQKVMLINPPIEFIEGEGDRPPLGILYLAAILEKYSDSSVKILDLTLKPEPNLQNELMKYKPDIVGITTTTPVFTKSAKIASFVKGNIPETILVAGGPHPSSMPIQTLNDSCFDVVVRGEGERTFLNLVKCIENGEDLNSVEGITFKINDTIKATANRELVKNLDELPFPARHLIPMDKYKMKINGVNSTTMISSRGCPYNCVYCTKSVFGHLFRARSPENVVSEIEHVIDMYDIKGFLFVDDTFTLNPDRVKKFCDMIIERNLDITWRCWTRSDRITKLLLKKIRDAGCAVICFGVESGDQNVLNRSRKGTKVETNLKAIKLAKDVGLSVKVFFMIGLPGESEKSVMKTIEFIEKSKPNTADFYVTVPFPNTYLWNHAEELGIRILSRDWKNYYQVGKSGHAPVVIETNDLSKADILKLHKKLRESFNKTWEEVKK